MSIPQPQKGAIGFATNQVAVGHAHDVELGTGVTVMHFPQRALAAAELIGGATSTRQFDSLRAGHGVGRIDALCFCGGSAFGLGASSGVLDVLRARGQGHQIADQIIPIAPAAALFDLFVASDTPPTPEMGTMATQAALAQSEPGWGSVGAGCGAAVGKALGIQYASKAGIGVATLRGSLGFRVTAMVAVNAFGDILTERGTMLAGCTKDRTENVVTGEHDAIDGGNTTLGVVVTDAALDKSALARVATMALQGYAWRIRPVFSPADGDVMVAASVASEGHRDDAMLAMAVGQLGAHAAAAAIEHAVESATAVGAVDVL